MSKKKGIYIVYDRAHRNSIPLPLWSSVGWTVTDPVGSNYDGFFYTEDDAVSFMKISTFIGDGSEGYAIELPQEISVEAMLSRNPGEYILRNVTAEDAEKLWSEQYLVTSQPLLIPENQNE